MEILTKIFEKPCIIGVVSDSNFGKSNFLYFLIKDLKKEFSFNLYTYGLRFKVGDIKINSINELEEVRDSVIILDEFYNILELEDRKKKKLVEKSIRLLFHNNNILILSGVCENFKKFISNKLNYIFFGKCTIGDMINGSKIKNICVNYCGSELGSNVLNIPKGELLLYDGHYNRLKIDYLSEFDEKKGNKSILCKSCSKSCEVKDIVEGELI